MKYTAIAVLKHGPEQSELYLCSKTLEGAKREALKCYSAEEALYVEDEDGQRYLVKEGENSPLITWDVIFGGSCDEA